MDTTVMTDSEDEAEAGIPFVFNPWKMKEVRRLYVNLHDGTKVGYLDLASMAAIPEAPGTKEQILQALGHLGAHSMVPRSDAARVGAGAVVRTQRSPMQWFDLSFNFPGRLIAGQENASYRAGVAGEQRTAGFLACLERHGYRILNSVPLSPRKDIDHLLIGPTGLFAINTKATTYEVTVKSDGAVYADGYRQNWVESITRDAGIAAGYLAAAARMELEIRPLVAAWSSIGVTGTSAALTAGEDLVGSIAKGESLYPDAWVDVLYNVARRSDTWTAHH